MGEQAFPADGDRTKREPWCAVPLGYFIALVAALLATMVRRWLDPVLGNHAPFVTYFAAAMFTAWYCGLGPSLLTIALGGLLGTYLFAQPRGSLYIHDLEHRISLLLYVCTGCFTALLSDWLRRAIARRNWVEAELQLREEELQRRPGRVDARGAAEHDGRNGRQSGARIEPTAARRQELCPRQRAAAPQEGREGRRVAVRPLADQRGGHSRSGDPPPRPGVRPQARSPGFQAVGERPGRGRGAAEQGGNPAAARRRHCRPCRRPPGRRRRSDPDRAGNAEPRSQRSGSHG